MSQSPVNNKRYDAILYSMDHTIELFGQVRKPDAVCTAAFDTLKQARAMVARALQQERESMSPFQPEMSAAGAGR